MKLAEATAQTLIDNGWTAERASRAKISGLAKLESRRVILDFRVDGESKKLCFDGIEISDPSQDMKATIDKEYVRIEGAVVMRLYELFRTAPDGIPADHLDASAHPVLIA